MTQNIYSCKLCKRLNEKDHKKGILGKYSLSSMMLMSKIEAINHLKYFHNIKIKEQENSHRSDTSERMQMDNVPSKDKIGDNINKGEKLTK